jgi:hypothetical protein
MGSFETEYEFMLAGNMRKSYEVARLFDPLNPEGFVIKHLRLVPGSSTSQFDLNLCQASATIQEMLLGVLQMHLYQQGCLHSSLFPYAVGGDTFRNRGGSVSLNNGDYSLLLL